MSFTTIKPLEELTIDDIRSNDWLNQDVRDRYSNKKIDYIKVNSTSKSGHSKGREIKFFNSKGREISGVSSIWIKEFFGNNDSFSEFYNAQRNPNLLFLKEFRANEAIKEILGNQFHPKLIGKDFLSKRLFYECLPSLNDRDRLISEKDNENNRRRIIYSAHRDIAQMGVMLESRRRKMISRIENDEENDKDYNKQFSDSIFSEQDRKKQLLDYLLTILKFKYEQTEGKKFEDCDDLKHYISNNKELHIAKLVKGLHKSSEELNYTTVWGHGDCRAHNLKLIIGNNGYYERKFIDWEQLGLCELGYDHVTYASAEGDISSLPIEEIEKLSEFIIHTRRITRLRDLNSQGKDTKIKDYDVDKLMHDAIGKSPGSKKKFSVQLLTLSIVEHLHLYSSNLRYSQAQRDDFSAGIDSWNNQKMFDYRPHKINEVFEFLSDYEIRDMKNGNEICNYLHFLAKSLTELEIVDVPELVLSKLSR